MAATESSPLAERRRTWNSVGNCHRCHRAHLGPSNELTGYATARTGPMKTIDGAPLGASGTGCGASQPGRRSAGFEQSLRGRIWNCRFGGRLPKHQCWSELESCGEWHRAASLDVASNQEIPRCVRGNQDGLYKTVNAGANWTRVGVAATTGTCSTFDRSAESGHRYALDQTIIAARSMTAPTWESLRMPSPTHTATAAPTTRAGQASLLAGVVRNAASRNADRPTGTDTSSGRSRRHRYDPAARAH